MKITIDNINKTLEIEEDIKVEDLNEFVKKFDLEKYTIKAIKYSNYITYPTYPYIPTITPDNPYTGTPWNPSYPIITYCSSN